MCGWMCLSVPWELFQLCSMTYFFSSKSFYVPPFQVSYLPVDWSLVIKRYIVVILKQIALLCMLLGVCGDIFSGKFFTVRIAEVKG